jgi:uncharacterized membrane protein
MTPLLWAGFVLMGIFTAILVAGLFIEERAIRSPRLYEAAELRSLDDAGEPAALLPRER